MKDKYKYFISYNFGLKNGKQGFGNIVLGTNNQINGTNLNEFRNDIIKFVEKEDVGLVKTIVILNFIRIEK